MTRPTPVRAALSLYRPDAPALPATHAGNALFAGHDTRADQPRSPRPLSYEITRRGPYEFTVLTDREHAGLPADEGAEFARYKPDCWVGLRRC